jgi:hypothetical protein
MVPPPVKTVAQLFAWLNLRLNVGIPTAPPPGSPAWLAELWSMPVAWHGSPIVPNVIDIDVVAWPIPTWTGHQFTLLYPKVFVASGSEDDCDPTTPPPA